MIKIITGRQTDQLQDQILNLAVNNYIENPQQETFIIVPNHIKFTTEVKTLNKLANLTGQEQVAVKNLQILSFSRLAWYFLRNEQIALPQILDDAASLMLLKQIVTKKQDQLLLFKDETINQGALKQLYEAVLLVRQGNLDLASFDDDQLDEETRIKIHDLNIVYDDFLTSLSNNFATKDEMQLLLNQYLAKQNLENSAFYFTDFSHFSLQEQMTVQLLSKKAKNITLAFKTKNGQLNPQAQAGDYDFIVQNTIKKLEHFWQNQTLDYQTDSIKISPNLSASERLNGVWTHLLPSKGQDLTKFIQPVKADSRYAEAYFVARTIYQQVALNKYRYRDFLILAPNLNEYETYLTPILRQNSIPFFNDLQKQMKFHPLVIAFENLYQIQQRGLQTSNLLAFIKSRLFIPDWYHDENEFQYDVDQLENFVLAHGIERNLWKRNLSNFVDAQVIALDDSEAQVQRLEKLRKYFIGQISDLLAALEQETDPQAGVTKFWEFLIKNGVAKRLEVWRSQANEAGDLQAAQEPEQVWSTLNTLLQDYLLLASKFDLEEFLELLVAGFGEANFSQIPSTLDAVNVSEIGMVQKPDYKQVFIIGATSSNLPKIEKIPGFFTSENIEQLSQAFDDNNYLEDQQKINNLDQNYQFGNALSLASDKVYLSYPVLNTANEELQPSIFYKQLLQMTGAQEFAQHDLPKNEQQVLGFVTNPAASLGYLTYLKKEGIVDSQPLLDLTAQRQPKLTNQVLLASDFKNIPVELSADLAQELYGKNIETSVSQLETYYENAYEYFLNYGLHLRKRFENELDVVQAGNYYHETFDRLVKLLKQQKLDLASLTTEQLQEFLKEIHQSMQEQGKYRQLLNDPFNKYLFRKLDQTTANVAGYWHRNLKKTILRPQYSELSFGRNQAVKGLSYQLKNSVGDHRIDLRGKMDRVDLATTEQGILGEVIDYKSSSKKFDLGLFANGISLQMVSYLEVLKQNQHFFAQEKNLSVLGAFYQTVTQHLERLNSDTNLLSNFQIKDMAKESQQKLMYNGILVADPLLLEQAEPLLKEERAQSELYRNVKRKVNGDFSLSATTSFSPEQLEWILKYNSYLIKQAAEQILAGHLQLNPYSYQNRTPLQYSDFKDIFFFDAMLKENNYHKINSLQKKDLLALIKEKLGEEEEND